MILWLIGSQWREWKTGAMCSYYSMLFYAILLYTILCYAMLCYAIVCYAILLYTKEKNRTLLSVPDRDGRFTWSLGAEKLPHSKKVMGSIPAWEKAENKFTATSGLPACVCVCVSCVASIYARVCSSVS